MALLFVDGFDSYTSTSNPELENKWTLFTNTLGSIQFQSTSGKFGGGALRFEDSNSGNRFHLNGSFGTYYAFGFWFKANIPPNAGQSIVTMLDTSSGSAFFQFGSNGTIQVTDWDNTTSHIVRLQTGRNICDDGWHWIEYRCFSTTGTGQMDIYVDGVLEDTYTGATVQAGAVNGNLDEIQVIAAGQLNSTVWWMDDFVLYTDTAGGAADPRASTDFPIGPLKIETIRPDSAGSNTGFTSNSTAANWENVDDSGAGDDDTSYNSSTSYTAVDTFGYESLTSTSVREVIGVQVNGIARKVGGETILSQHVVISSGSTGNGSQLGHSETYVGMLPYVLTEDPATSTAWTTAALDAVEFGYATSSST